ncbi:MAG: ABC transporter substrate-binding protein [Clostridiales bacterium]|nr:ABC transporter substrate-binding protein [Clostridiales bacterium]
MLTGCKGQEGASVNSQEDFEEAVMENIDEDTGLIHIGQMELKYAESFSVDYYQGGYKIITDWNGRRTLLVPEGKEVPQLKADINVIHLPIESVGVFATTAAAELRPLGLLDKISLVTTEVDDWHIPEVKEGMEEGRITYVGRNSSPDYGLIQAIKPDLVLITTGTGHGTDEVAAKFDELGIKWISRGSQRESDPRGRLEWVKFVGALFDKEEEAEEFYDAQLKKIEEIEERVANLEGEREKFASFFLSNDIYYVRNKGDYEVKMIELAGGEYILSHLNPDQDGNSKMNAEELYKGIEDVDTLFYHNRMGRSIQSIDDIIASAEYFADINAVRDRRVWGYKPHYFQHADRVADMIEDLYTIFTTPHGEITETEYFFLMD